MKATKRPHNLGQSLCLDKCYRRRARHRNPQENYSAHKGVEPDDMNILCTGGPVVGPLAARNRVDAFLAVILTGEGRHMLRLQKVATLEVAQRAAEESGQAISS